MINTKILLGMVLIAPLIVRLCVSRLKDVPKFWKISLDIMLVILFVIGAAVLIALM